MKSSGNGGFGPFFAVDLVEYRAIIISDCI